MYFSGRKEIDGKKYFGPIGKMQFLYSQCGLHYDESTEEIQMILKLKEFRDLLAHAKTEENTIPVSYPHGQIPELIVTEVWQCAQSDLRESAYNHLKPMIKQLHKCALTAFPDIELESVAFKMSFCQSTDII